MPESFPPRSAGVYQIRCIPTGRIYIGGTVDLRNRWQSHLRKLRRGRHANIRLQQAWNKHGEENFKFFVLQLVTASELLDAEQTWIDKTACTDKKIGFNVCSQAGSPGGTNVRIWTNFIGPAGNRVTITNLHEFCRRHRLDFPSMHKLWKGKSKLKSYKGWTHPHSVRQRDYIKTYDGFIDPNGRHIGKITNLAAFSREHGLDNTHMLAVMRGRICSHRGWTHINGRRRTVKTYSSFIDPNGQKILVTNLAKFCREHRLHPVRMHNLISGLRKSHKGWTWRNDR